VASAPAPVAPTAPVPATVDPPGYVWDGTWLHARVPAGIGSMSENIHQPSGTRSWLDNETRGLYEFGCARKVGLNPDAFEHIECGNRTDITYFYFINKTNEELDVQYHFGPFKEN
jgi:hypothetical protein